MSSFQVSPERISDGTARLYSCFCDKIFTTYPGIYLHLKSKHGNLFQKYKKLKITKLFQKIKAPNGREMYRLQKLNQKQRTDHNFNQKKFKQLKKRTKSVLSSARQVEQEQSSLAIDRKREKNIPVLRSHEQVNAQQRIRPVTVESPPKEKEKEKEKQSLPGYQYFPYPRGFESQHQQIFNSYNYGRFNPPTVKKLFQAYLIQSESLDKKELKNALYNVMVFLDKNYEYLRDPRCHQIVFLSYCDLFDHHFVGPMMQQYIHHFGIHILETESEQARECKKRQLQHLLLFAKWLKYCNIMDLHIQEFPSSIKQLGLSIKQGSQIQFNFKYQKISEEEGNHHAQLFKLQPSKKDLFNANQQPTLEI